MVFIGHPSPCQHNGNPLVKMAAWMEEDDASELQDYLRGFHSRSKGGDVDWNAMMEGGNNFVVDGKGARGLGRSKPSTAEARQPQALERTKGGNRFLKGRSTAAKGSKGNKSDSVSSKASSHSTILSANEFLKNNSLSPSAIDRGRRTSSSVSSLLSDDVLSEREEQPVAEVESTAHTSLHSDESTFESADDTHRSVASEHANPQSWRNKSSSSSPSTPSTVAVELPRVQFAADLTSSLSEAPPELVATADSVSEQLSTVVTEVREDAPSGSSGQDGRSEEGGYDEDTFEDVSVLDDSHVGYRTVSHQSGLTGQGYGDSDFEESVVESANSSDQQTCTEGEDDDDEEVNDNEDDDDEEVDDGSDDDRSTESQESLTETSQSVTVEQTKNVPAMLPLTKTSSTGVQTDVAFTTGTIAPPPPSVSVLQSLLTMPTIGAAGSLNPPSAAVLDDLLRQHIHLARQSMDFTRAVAGRIEANLNTDHRYTTLQDTRKYIATCKPLPVYRRGL